MTTMWKVEVPKVTDDRFKVFVGTLKAAAKVVENTCRLSKDVTKEYETREILYKGECIAKQHEWTGEWTWFEKWDEMNDQIHLQFELTEKEREAAAKKEKKEKKKSS